ncbi:tetraprenyl-beta-curcumene synthase family protein [Bacillus smithii]|uniref:tetraprenyl-beta-curcumene synthase family protein n=1 Tax=Bacillus smithii TaxID=1479 RepID=UPI003D217CA4
MTIPTHPFSLMGQAYRKVFPTVHKELNKWKQKANSIPDQELKKQALASIEHKTFHCEGGSILALLSGEHFGEAVKFIVAYQTISDYLDNLCDRSTSLDPKDFAALHESMIDALTVGAPFRPYYRFRNEQEDGGYLRELVGTCQSVLQKIKHYPAISSYLLELCRYYCDLQIHKHVCVEEREERLKKWFSRYKDQLPKMEWFEFSACSGSTLGIFCLVSYAFRDDFKPEYASMIREAYFPYIQGLHILLDYFIDQEEDRKGGDLNFCFYYDSQEELLSRFQYFIQKADSSTKHLPHAKFHQLINRGLLGIYLSEDKVNQQKDVQSLAKKIIRFGGSTSYFFYYNGRMYRKFRQHVSK